MSKWAVFMLVQIHLCTCSAGSASTTEVNRKRAATAFCKSCGGKPFVNGQGSSHHSMLSTVGLELNSLINSDLTWKSISKGNRSASRRARKSVAKSSEVKSDLVQDNLESLDMPVSESEKLGVTLLGCRFNEKAEHVPIKKRRFLFRSPSPPRRTLPPRWEGAARLLTGKRSSRNADSVMGCKHVALDASASAVDMCQIVDMDSDVGRKDLLGINKRLGDGEDFSGISILAAAACSSSMEEDVGCVEEGHKLGDSSSNGGPHEVLTNDESCLLSKVLPNGDFGNSAETSNEGANSCVSIIPGEELATSGVNNSGSVLPQNDVDLQDSSVVVSPVCLGDRDGRTARRNELSLRDERLHWDLNTEMDEWKHPFSGYVDSEKNVADGTSAAAEIGKDDDKRERVEGHETLRESEDTICETENKQLSVGIRTLETREFEEGKFEVNGCSNNDASFGTAFSDPTDNPLEPSTSAAGDKDAVIMDVIIVSSGTPDACSSDQNPGKGLFSSPSRDILAETCIDKGNCGTILIKDADKCAVAAQLNETIYSSPATETQDVSHQLKAFSGVTNLTENLQIEDRVIQIGSNKGFSTISTKCYNGNASVEDNQSSSPAPNDATIEHRILNSDGTQIQQSPPLCKDQPAPGPLLVDESTIVLDRVIGDPGVAVQETNAEAAADMHDDAAEPIEKTIESHTNLSDASCEHSSQDALKCADINDSDKVDLSGPFEDNYSLGVSQDGASVLAGSKEMTEIQDGYDSPYEDGEFRESIHHTWDYYDIEDGEAEQVDYGSDNKELYGFDASGGHFSGVVKEHPKLQSVDVKDVDSEVDSFMKSSKAYLRVPLPLKDDTAEFANASVGNANMVRDDVDAKVSGWDRLLGVRRCSSDTDGDLRDGARRKILSREGSELVVDENGDRVAGSRPCRRGFLSHIEGPECNDAILQRQNHFKMRRSSDHDSTDSLVKRESVSGKSGTVRYTMHHHSRGHVDDQRPNSSEGRRGLKKHRLPTFYGQDALHRPGPENDSAATVAKVEDHGFVTSERAVVKSSLGLTICAVRQNEHSISSSVHWPFRRSGSPTDRDGAFGKHSSLRSSGEMSPDRFSTVAHRRPTKCSSRVDNRGFRGKCHGQVGDDSIAASFNRPHFVQRRDISFSPAARKGDPQLPRSRSRSPSRSRSRSPILWSSPRGRNGPSFCGNPYVRHRSRSPNFRPEARTRQMRSPHPRTGFVPDHSASFVPMQRSRGSPPYDPRWIDDRKDGEVQFRGHVYKPRYPVLNRRSPGKICLRGEKCDLVDSPRKMKPIEYSRRMHPGRYSDMEGVGRGPRYEETKDDRRRNGYRYGLPPVRRYDMFGAVKRIRYNAEDDFVSTQNSHNKDAPDFQGRGSPKGYNRGLDGRLSDFQRRSRDEKGPGFYRRDGKYSNSDRSFGIREFDEDVTARRRRPS